MKMGFIGAGNMGGAILKGILEHHFLNANDIMVYDINQQLCNTLKERYGITTAVSASELTQSCEWIILAVKPVFLKDVFQEIKRFLSGKKLISIAAGWSTEMLFLETDGADVQIARVMPNTPALVGAGMTALCEDTNLEKSDFDWVKELFETLGEVEIFPERLFDAVIAVSGSSPAYVFMFIEAMADAAVKLGMPRKTALHAAAQSVLGSAKMVLDTQEHPAVLKDQVCSPGGTTIEAVQVLEMNGLRSAVMQAMVACADKNQKIMEQQKGKGKA